MKALDKQHGGDHYKNKTMQPVELWAALNLNGFQASIVKYITRHKEKNGAEDIDKAEHFFDLMIELGQPAIAFGYDVNHVAHYGEANGFNFFTETLAIMGALEQTEVFKSALSEIRRENGYPVK